MNNILEINNLYSIISSPKGPVHVLNDISFAIPKGKIIGIIGESGSGKTEMMKAITGTQRLTPGVVSGSVNYFDSATRSLYPSQRELDNEFSIYPTIDGNYKRKNEDLFKRKVRSNYVDLRGTIFGIIPQDSKSYLNPFWTVEQFFQDAYNRLVESPLMLDTNFDEFLSSNLEKFDLDAKATRKKYPNELSGGQAQRVMNAFVLAHRPRIIFANESTTGLDVGRQKKVIEHLSVLSEEDPSNTIIIISHDIAFLSHLVEIYYVLFNGFLFESIYDLKRLNIREMLHPYTGDLLSSLTPDISDIEPAGDNIKPAANLTEKLTGCPYVGRCGLFANGDGELKNKCKNELPPAVEKPTGKPPKSLNMDWQRCWHRYLDQQ